MLPLLRAVGGTLLLLLLLLLGWWCYATACISDSEWCWKSADSRAWMFFVPAFKPRHSFASL